MLHFKDFDFPPLATSPEQPDSTTNPAPPRTCEVMELPIGQVPIGRPPPEQDAPRLYSDVARNATGKTDTSEIPPQPIFPQRMAHSRSRSSKHSRNDRLRVGADEPTSSACSARRYTSTLSVTSVPTTSEATEERQQRNILSVSGTPDLPRSETLALRGPGDYVKGTSWATWEYQFNTLMKMRRITNDKDKMFQLVSELGNAVMTELRIVLSEQDGEPSYSSMIQALCTMYGDHDSPLMHRDVLISTRQRDRTFATRSSCLRLSEASRQKIVDENGTAQTGGREHHRVWEFGAEIHGYLRSRFMNCGLGTPTSSLKKTTPSSQRPESETTL